MKTKHVKLTKLRASLCIALLALQDDLEDAPIERKASVQEEISRNQWKLDCVEREILIIELNELYAKDNVKDKPVTVILKEN